MSLIQILLVCGTLSGLWLYFSFFKSVTRNRVLLLTLCGIGVLLVLFPEALTFLAHSLGVGRGTDLLFYLSLLIGFFAILNLNAKISMLERERTQLARELALLEEKLSRAHFDFAASNAAINLDKTKP
jgi:hypothetical protein